MTRIREPLDILIVEDESLIRWAISRTLTGAGHRVAEASDAASAVELLASGKVRPQVVLLDYRLPDTRGLSLLTAVRSLAPDAGVVMMTADATPDVMRAIECGVERVMLKPFDMADVEPALVDADRAREQRDTRRMSHD